MVLPKVQAPGLWGERGRPLAHSTLSTKREIAMAGADTTTKHEPEQGSDKAVNAGEEPLEGAEIGDEQSGGVAGQGGMRGQTQTSDDGKFHPS
jgi:hypothetical protein